MTVVLIVAVWVVAPIAGVALLVASGRVVDAYRRRRAGRDLAICNAILAATPAAAPEPCPEHGHACQPQDHQPGSAR